MRKERPASVLTLAILHLIGGGLGLLWSICLGIDQIIMASVASGGGPPMKQDLGIRTMLHLQQQVPSFQPVNIVDVLVRFVLGTLLLVGGIGLLKMQPWARYVSLGYAGLSIFEKITMCLYRALVVWPVANKFIAAEALRDPTVRTSGELTGVRLGLGLQIAFVVLVVYPVVVAIILLLPGVSKAFTASPRRRDEDEDEGWGGRRYERDRYDDRYEERGYGRRERERYDDRPRRDRWGEERDDHDDQRRPDDYDRRR